MNASLPHVRLMEDGTLVMDCRRVAVFAHLKYPRFLERLRQKVEENPRCWKFFPGLPHPIPQKRALDTYEIWTSAAGVNLIFQDGATRKALLRAFNEPSQVGMGPEPSPSSDIIPANPEASASSGPDPEERQLTDNEWHFDPAKFRTAILNGQPAIVAQDLVEALDGIWNGEEADHVPEKFRGLMEVHGAAGVRKMVGLTEAGMNFYLIRSNKPKAARLQEFVSEEVLPSIRRTGAYVQAAPDDPIEVIIARGIEAAKIALDRHKARADKAESEISGHWQPRVKTLEFENAAKEQAKLEAEELAAREGRLREDAEAKHKALRKAFSELADDENLMLPSDAATNFKYGLQPFMDWMEAGGWFKWRRSAGKKVGPAIATEDAVRKGIALNQFRPYPIPEKRDESGSVIRAARKKMTTQAYLTMDGYLWLHQALPELPAQPQGKLPIPRPEPTKH